ncbi:MAG: PASTA domain-containing protein, partial [Solirubrobacterales bacterium]|nr:PASTA domain-containing protein [Solirubrobacterales bacterium]
WRTPGSCGPAIAPLDSSFGQANAAINCAGSLLGSNLPVGGSRSEVQIDGQDAYDAASAQAVFSGGEDLGANFPVPRVSVNSDPGNGLAQSQTVEGWVVCSSPVSYPPTSTTCPTFAPAGVQLHRDIATSDGGLVVTMTDTWSSTDARAHSLDLLYDDIVGLTAFSTQRGYEFPGQSAFTAYGQGASLPAPGPGPGSILVRSNLAAADGDPSEAAGAITFATPPSGFTFVGNNEFEEHRILQVPAGGSTSVTYIYSSAFAIAQARALALTAQDHLQPLAVSVTSPANGATTSTPSATVTGTATAGSGISSVLVAGQTVPVGPGGAWSATVPLAPGPNTISVLATDGAGATAQGQLGVIYQLPAPPLPAARCKVPRTKGMKLSAAEKALRRAHCRVGRIKRVRSKKIARGRVTSTKPGVGRRFPAGHKVEIFLSKGA